MCDARVAEPPIHILLAESHPLMRLGLRALFDLETEMEVVAETRDGNEALMLIERLLPDVAILDTCLPGTEVAQIVKVIGQRQYPTQVLALSPGLHEDDQLQKAILAGAKGCLLKSNARRNAVRAVEMVANGDAWFSYEIIREMAAACEGEAQPPVQRPKLTPREREVLGLLRRGWTNRHIAYDLGIKERTIRFHLGNIYRKLEVSSRAEASVWAVENGIGEPEDRK